MRNFSLRQPFFAVIDTKNCILRIKGGSVGQSITVKLGDGSFTYDEKVNRQYLLDRGLLDTVRNGDQVPVDVKLDSQWETVTADTDAEVPTVEDALKRRGPAADWDSTSADPCEPYAVDIELINNIPCAETPEKIILPDFRYEDANHDMKAGTISFSGKCNATEAIVTRTVSTN